VPDIDTLARVLIALVATIAALGLVWFTKREMRWYADNVQVEPEPPLPRILRRGAVMFRRWRKGEDAP
jgi:hypothetical protein